MKVKAEVVIAELNRLLKSGKVADPERRERLLELMAGECGRLGRYLHNVLDFGRIEQDVKSYDIRETDLVPVVAGVVEIVRPAAAEEGLALDVALPAGPVPVEPPPPPPPPPQAAMHRQAMSRNQMRLFILSGSLEAARCGVTAERARIGLSGRLRNRMKWR